MFLISVLSLGWTSNFLKLKYCLTAVATWCSLNKRWIFFCHSLDIGVCNLGTRGRCFFGFLGFWLVLFIRSILFDFFNRPICVPTLFQCLLLSSTFLFLLSDHFPDQLVFSLHWVYDVRGDGYWKFEVCCLIGSWCLCYSPKTGLTHPRLRGHNWVNFTHKP